MGEIAAAAIKRSDENTPSTTATLKQEDWTTWDRTMMGRIVEWMTGDIRKDFSITGGKVNRGKREKDVAISEINSDRRWASMIAAGCRVTGIHWISETLTDDEIRGYLNYKTTGNSTTMGTSNGSIIPTIRKRLGEKLLKNEQNGVNGPNM